MEKKIHNFDYSQIHSEQGLLNYCVVSEQLNKSKPHSSWIKNYITNVVYISKELTDVEKLIFLFLYDLKCQQKYLPGIQVSQKKIARILNLSESTVSRALIKLKSYAMVLDERNIFDDPILIPNENIETWQIQTVPLEIGYIEELRKHNASSNKQLTELYKRLKSGNY